MAANEGTVTGHQSNNNSIYGLRSTCLHHPLVWLAAAQEVQSILQFIGIATDTDAATATDELTNTTSGGFCSGSLPSIPFRVQKVSVSVVRFLTWTEARKIINSLIVSTPHDLVVRLRS